MVNPHTRIYDCPCNRCKRWTICREHMLWKPIIKCMSKWNHTTDPQQIPMVLKIWYHWPNLWLKQIFVVCHNVLSKSYDHKKIHPMHEASWSKATIAIESITKMSPQNHMTIRKYTLCMRPLESDNCDWIYYKVQHYISRLLVQYSKWWSCAPLNIMISHVFTGVRIRMGPTTPNRTPTPSRTRTPFQDISNNQTSGIDHNPVTQVRYSITTAELFHDLQTQRN